MTSRQGGHAEKPLPPSTSRPPAAPRLQVQRSLSRDNITIHFSALGKEEEEEEEELYWTTVSSSPPSTVLAGNADDVSKIAEALEASEEMEYGVDSVNSVTDPTVLPMFSSSSTVTLPPMSGPQDQGPTQPFTFGSLSTAAKGPAATQVHTSATSKSSSPSRSITLTSTDKPFFSLIKSLSSDLEPREGVPLGPTVSHRQLMKNLVKSLSSDTSQEASGSFRLPDSRSLQLFKQFTQPRGAAASSVTGGDSKTAPSSPLTSPDSRFGFKVSEVEARIEDTKRRLSEVMFEPLQLLSKMIGDESASTGSLYRPKGLSSSASELSNLASFNGHLESNNNYSIKEEEGDSDEEGAANASSVAESLTDTRGVKPGMPLALEKCSMSALARQEDEEFYELYSEDFDFDNETDGDRPDDSIARSKGHHLLNTDTFIEDELEGEEPDPSIPLKTLFALTLITYGYFVLPLPTYVGGMFFGTFLGFMLAVGVIWLAGPRRSGGAAGHKRIKKEMCNTAQLDIKEPGMFKGWMNEIQNYDPETYHATLTHSVFVRLEGSTLRLSKPNRNVARRATINEPKHDICYVSQKIFDLTDSKIHLVPQSLARKRVWNKKYPVCIELGKQDDFMSKAESEADEERPADSLLEKSEVAAGAGVEEAKRPGQEACRPSGSKSHLATLYLFGRTGREKEEWFQRLLVASRLKAETAKKAASLPVSKSSATLTSHSRSSSRSSLDELFSQPRQKDSSGPAPARPRPALDYSDYMGRCMPPEEPQVGSAPASSPQQSPHSSPAASKKLPGIQVKEDESVAWVNALVGRVAWDFLGEKYWVDWVSKKIQMKLSKIRLPYFMNELTLTELDMGLSTPRILQASKPSVDHQGLWFDLEIAYKGSFLMTLETKMNLARLGKEGEGFGEFGKDGPRAYCLADSDEESSSAGSSDEEDPSELTPDQTAGAEGYVGGHKPSKIMRFVDKITKSKYFQKATETEFIKKKMEEVSNTPLLLTVEVQEIRGTLAVNIPPPPTDRIWYGFRTPPRLDLKARPKLGEREVTFAHVTDWIEKKLYQEFQKILVMPNMDDLWLHIMHSATDPRSHPAPSESEAPPSSDL
ncbi:testis-expressed protein 2 isoform X2 [Clupea harengus]|uniref:Testis-expressed protein 2 isoform X2 n=1 Tax=Clupea harengus TaxID=7950 RepID=A0A6P3VWL1_CLUHA|nr:testis-expressed protein 2 isoform X2 [Clupea harengus]